MGFSSLFLIVWNPDRTISILLQISPFQHQDEKLTWTPSAFLELPSLTYLHIHHRSTQRPRVVRFDAVEETAIVPRLALPTIHSLPALTGITPEDI